MKNDSSPLIPHPGAPTLALQFRQRDSNPGAAGYRRQAQDALESGDNGLAIACLENAIRDDPADVETYRTLGRILRLAGRPGEAAAWYRRCLEIAPDDSIAIMGLVALGEAPAPERLPDDVILYIFDRNAGSYEANMRSLGYSAPEVLLGLLRANGDVGNNSLDILDLGCGSGWCGPLLRPYARRLVGVDLSSHMLDLAADKRVYDELIQAEILEYLARTADGFDAVIAANVLVYFGNLAPLTAGVARVLRPDGRFIFDVELGEGSEPGFHVSGRYTHSRAVLESALLPSGFSFTQVQQTAMRTEQGAAVAGLYCAASRSR